MPLLVILIGILLIIVAVRGYVSQLGSLLRGDLLGKGNFFYWLAAIVVVGMLGFIDGPPRTLSRTFLALILVTMVVSNGGIWAKFVSAINSPPKPLPIVQGPGLSSSSGSSSGSSSKSGGLLGGITKGLGSIL